MDWGGSGMDGVPGALQLHETPSADPSKVLVVTPAQGPFQRALTAPLNPTHPQEIPRIPGGRDCFSFSAFSLSVMTRV